MAVRPPPPLLEVGCETLLYGLVELVVDYAVEVVWHVCVFCEIGQPHFLEMEAVKLFEEAYVGKIREVVLDVMVHVNLDKTKRVLG